MTVYSNFFPTTAEFERRMQYNDLESLYATYYMRQLYNGKVSSSDFNNNYVYVYNNGICIKSKNNSSCNTIAKKLGIEEMIITTNNIKSLKNSLNSISDSNISSEFKKYIKYLPDYSITGDTSEEYRIILKTDSGYATSLLNYEKPTEANKPLLTDNLFPIKYDSSGNIILCDEDDSDWYNYEDAKWANAVTLKSSARSNYSVGDVISISDINTMWVWIPRYKYTIFNYNIEGTNAVNIQSINIQFEQDTQSTGTISCSDTLSSTSASEVCYYTPENKQIASSNQNEMNGNATYTHPAFTFGFTELTGIWVGKYENSFNSSNNVEIIPGVDLSGKGKDVSKFFELIKSMELYNNQYGFYQGETATSYNYDSERNGGNLINNDINNLDTHMIKNIEWGAVTYLSLSKYGIYAKTNGGFSTNANTGRYASVNTVGRNTTRTTGSGTVKTSSTNNYSGIYDMAGGTAELVMGATKIDSEKDYVQLYFDGLVIIWTTAADNNTRNYLSNNKYYDLYYASNSSTNYKAGKLGDATREVSWTSSSGETGWFSGGIRQFPDYSNNAPVFTRGGEAGDTFTSILAFNSSSGHADYMSIASRSVLAINPN